MTRQQIIDDFHVLFYDEASKGITWGGTTYCGVKIWKSPLDLQLYQELIWRLRPRVIVETGTAFGGSALFMAHILDIIGHGDVISIDVKPYDHRWPNHRRISYLPGRSSTDRAVAEVIDVYRGEPLMVILDSDHRKHHVLAELDLYAPLVSENSYLIVEDTNICGHPVFPEHLPGPQEALDEWLPKHPEFEIDHHLPAQMLFSMHTWLKRRRM